MSGQVGAADKADGLPLEPQNLSTYGNLNRAEICIQVSYT